MSELAGNDFAYAKKNEADKGKSGESQSIAENVLELDDTIVAPLRQRIEQLQHEAMAQKGKSLIEAVSGDCKILNGKLTSTLRDIGLRARRMGEMDAVVGYQVSEHHLALGEMNTPDGRLYVAADASYPQHNPIYKGLLIVGNIDQVRAAVQMTFGGKWQELDEEFLAEHLSGDAKDISFGGPITTQIPNYDIRDVRDMDVAKIDWNEANLQVAQHMLQVRKEHRPDEPLSWMTDPDQRILKPLLAAGRARLVDGRMELIPQIDSEKSGASSIISTDK